MPVTLVVCLSSRAGRRHTVKSSDPHHPSKLTSAGWKALWAYGIRTIVSLETSNLSAARDRLENPPLDIPAEYAGIVHIQAAVQDGSDLDYMAKWANTGLWGTHCSSVMPSTSGPISTQGSFQRLQTPMAESLFTVVVATIERAWSSPSC